MCVLQAAFGSTACDLEGKMRWLGGKSCAEFDTVAGKVPVRALFKALCELLAPAAGAL